MKQKEENIFKSCQEKKGNNKKNKKTDRKNENVTETNELLLSNNEKNKRRSNKKM